MVNGTILYAEDYPAVRKIISTFLERRLPEHRCEIFSNGLELEERLKQGADGISLVVTDNQMPPGITGYELIQKYSQQKGFDKVPFVLLSGDFAESFSLDQFPNSRYLSKDLSPNKVMDSLKEILDSYPQPTTLSQ